MAYSIAALEDAVLLTVFRPWHTGGFWQETQTQQLQTEHVEQQNLALDKFT